MRRLRGIKRAVLITLTLAVAVVSFGCDKSIKITTGLKDDVIFRLSDKECSLSEILLVLINEKNTYEKDFGEGIWDKNVQDISIEESVKEEIKEQQIYMDAIYLFAQEQNITLSEEEEQKISEAAERYFEMLTDEEKNIMNITKEDIEDIYKKSLLGKKVYDSVASKTEYEVSDEEARVMSAMYIFVQGNDDEAYQKISQAYEEIKAGADFYTIASEYSDDDIIQLEIGRDEFAEDIEKNAFSLASGEYTDILETENGFYIVKCVESYIKDKTESNKASILTEKQNEEFLKVFNPFLEKLELDFNDKVWEKIKLSDYEECTNSELFEVYGEYFEE